MCSSDRRDKQVGRERTVCPCCFYWFGSETGQMGLPRISTEQRNKTEPQSPKCNSQKKHSSK